MMYLTLKFLHIVGVILLLGTITTGVFWKAHADKSRDPNFSFRIAPLQREMRDLARSATDAASFDWGKYERLSRSWAIWGTIALLAASRGSVDGIQADEVAAPGRSGLDGGG